MPNVVLEKSGIFLNSVTAYPFNELAYERGSTHRMCLVNTSRIFSCFMKVFRIHTISSYETVRLDVRGVPQPLVSKAANFNSSLRTPTQTPPAIPEQNEKPPICVPPSSLSGTQQ